MNKIMQLIKQIRKEIALLKEETSSSRFWERLSFVDTQILEIGVFDITGGVDISSNSLRLSSDYLLDIAEYIRDRNGQLTCGEYLDISNALQAISADEYCYVSNIYDFSVIGFADKQEIIDDYETALDDYVNYQLLRSKDEKEV